MANTLINAKRLAYECQREVLRRRVRPAVRLDRDARRRARRLMNEMVMYWKRNEKYERERRRRAEREMEERRRREEEEREAKRQQRKFNYLITQTELYAHFMRNKQGGTFTRRRSAAHSCIVPCVSGPCPSPRLCSPPLSRRHQGFKIRHSRRRKHPWQAGRDARARRRGSGQ